MLNKRWVYELTRNLPLGQLRMHFSILWFQKTSSSDSNAFRLRPSSFTLSWLSDAAAPSTATASSCLSSAAPLTNHALSTLVLIINSPQPYRRQISQLCLLAHPLTLHQESFFHAERLWLDLTDDNTPVSSSMWLFCFPDTSTSLWLACFRCCFSLHSSLHHHHLHPHSLSKTNFTLHTFPKWSPSSNNCVLLWGPCCHSTCRSICNIHQLTSHCELWNLGQKNK